MKLKKVLFIISAILFLGVFAGYSSQNVSAASKGRVYTIPKRFRGHWVYNYGNGISNDLYISKHKYDYTTLYVWRGKKSDLKPDFRGNYKLYGRKSGKKIVTFWQTLKRTITIKRKGKYLMVYLKYGKFKNTQKYHRAR